MNLNGPWKLKFDKDNQGEKEGWQRGTITFPEKITVPFPWGSKLSGVDDKAFIAWYARRLRVPDAWRGKKVFLVIGACDWNTTVWLDGKLLGQHKGGYTPFEFDLTPSLRWGQAQHLVLRVDDSPHAFKLEGKQGYGPARGIWQTAYLEARVPLSLDVLHFTPDIDHRQVEVEAALNEPATSNLEIVLHFKTGEPAQPDFVQTVPKGAREVKLSIPISNLRLWTLEDPFLYEVEVVLRGSPTGEDRVHSYFGMRKISVVPLPGLQYPYVALNNKPVYLQMTLDQAYHPDGFYTFPSDEFMRDEILRSRRLGLNAMRIHVKIESPRKLYWADRLGLLIMADVPNSWGEPGPEMRAGAEFALRGMIRRDYNHPSIFSWVLFNETWGLFNEDKQNNRAKRYLPETQGWVASMVRLAKSLDHSRLVEDNSACNLDHVVTDLNTWHSYLPGYGWKELLDQVTRDTYPGSHWNFIGSNVQATQPLLNSECGNVWGYEGSTGDVDWSWDYHLMMNEFRRHPKIGGWLYTEHHDVINEWNGYYRFDRTNKMTGLEEFVPGMTLRDLHAPFYIAPEGDLCRQVQPGSNVLVPLWASFLTDRAPSGVLQLDWQLYGWDSLGLKEIYSRSTQTLQFKPWMSDEIPAVSITMPNKTALAVLKLMLEDGAGNVLHRNFTTFYVSREELPRDETLEGNGQKLRVLRFKPGQFRAAKWSLKQWNVLDGLKVDGAGSGYFEYRLAWPDGLKPEEISGATLTLEVSAKQLFGKDRQGASKVEGDFMRGKGTHDPSANPNSYPMTDTNKFPSSVRVRVGGECAGVFDLQDDPADHRGILSWFSQKRDKRLREAGSYGELITAVIPQSAVRTGADSGEIVIRLEVDESLPGGLAVYGERFGRYPVEPVLVFALKP